MNNKQIAFAGVWSRYMPAIRILIKKAVAAEQAIIINQTDVEQAAGIKKTGYRFSVNFIKGYPGMSYSNNDIAQAFISVLAEDEVIKGYLRSNDYVFSFNSKYKLQIKVNQATAAAMSADMQETVAR